MKEGDTYVEIEQAASQICLFGDDWRNEVTIMKKREFGICAGISFGLCILFRLLGRGTDAGLFYQYLAILFAVCLFYKGWCLGRGGKKQVGYPLIVCSIVGLAGVFFAPSSFWVALSFPGMVLAAITNLKKQ